MPRKSSLRWISAAAVWLCLFVPAAWPAPPPFEDTLAQRLLPCTLCHGKEGRAAPDGYYPRIAGKPAGYLFNQLQNFRDGRRHYDLMLGLLEVMDEAYLRAIAQHFAALDLPYTAPAPVQAGAAQLARGETLVRRGDASRKVAACADCHGAQLTGVAPNVPGLLGLSRDYLNAQLGAWRTGQRRAHAPDCMAQLAQALQQSDVSAVTAWLATQVPPADSRPVTARPAGTLAPVTCGSAPEAGGALR